MGMRPNNSFELLVLAGIEPQSINSMRGKAVLNHEASIVLTLILP